MTDTTRKAFEGWFSTVLAHYQPTDDATVNRRDWKVWQAATLTAKIPLEKRIAELEAEKSGPYFLHYQSALSKIARLEAKLKHVELAFNEWGDKTEWVQKTARPKELGKHRADVLRERITELEAQLEAVGAGGVGVIIPAAARPLEVAASVTDALGAVPWRERWYGSSLDKGWSILQGRDLIAYLGPDTSSEAVTAIVMAHNVAATAALADQPVPAVVGLGWKLVPVDLTPEMIEAYLNTDGFFHSARSDWAAMLDAAPQPQQIAEPASQWISVDERLPEFGLEVLTCHMYSDSEEVDIGIHWRDGPDIEQGTGNTANFLFGSAHGVLVTHWMPLPTPPSTPKEPS